MNKGYFDVEEEKNKTTLLQLCLSVVKGLIGITSIRVDKTFVGKEYRAVIFFKKKKDK